jgi:hypothetical protein
VSTAPNRRIAYWSLRLLPLAVTAFVWFFGVQCIVCWKVRQFEKSNPVLRVIPQPLRDAAPAKQPGLKLSVYGYEFEVPWGDIDKEKTRSGDFATIYYFRSGPFLMFSNPKKAANAKETILADDEKRKVATQMWGEKALGSNFALTKAILETTPAQMSVFAPRPKVVGLGMLLMLKMVPATGGETGIFAFDTPTLRGFQMGDPDKKPKSLSVRALDMGDHQLEITFGIQSGYAGQITQSEVNRVLQTVRPAGKSEDGSGTELSASRREAQDTSRTRL